jgi:hypothetical protein
MARKKNSKAVPMDAPYNGGTKHWSIGIDEAENGFTINTSSEGKEGYKSKKFIAPNERAAIRIATAHISGMGGTKSKGKKGKAKKGAGKMSVSKRA